jgi:hypothetical protein
MEGQVLVSEADERQLRAVAAATDTLLRDVRTVLRECLAWEATAAGQAAVLSAPAPSAQVRGRPAAYTAAQVKDLLQHHVQLCAADGTRFDQSAFARRPTMQSVAELLRLAALSPVKFSEVPYLAEVHRLGLCQVDAASTILVRAEQLCEARTRLTLDRVRYPLSEVRALLVRMHTFPFRSEEVDALQALVSRAEAWREEVVQLSGGSLKSSAPEATDTAVAVTTSRSSRKSDAASSASKPIPLKKVEALIAEGERLPFELAAELDVLKEKRQLAKVWLEKLKKSFVPTKAGSGRGRRGAEEAAGGPAEKLSLADMKMMVSEGASLYQEPLEEEATEGERGAAVLGRSGVVSSRTANRELDRAQAVVDTAEDWISRVKDLLCGGGDSDREGEQEAAADGEGRMQEDQEAEDDESEESGAERTMVVLRAMLEEAETMPVALDEYAMLRHHLQALEWAARVRPVLAVQRADQECPPVTAEEVGAEAPEPEDKRRVGRGAAAGLPRLAEMQQHAREITRCAAPHAVCRGSRR